MQTYGSHLADEELFVWAFNARFWFLFSARRILLRKLGAEFKWTISFCFAVEIGDGAGILGCGVEVDRSK